MKDNIFDTAMQMLCKEAITKFGAEKQIQKAIEEMGELLTELGRLPIGRTDNKKIIEEIVDVSFMMLQLAYAFGIDDYINYIDVKKRKIEQRLSKIE